MHVSPGHLKVSRPPVWPTMWRFHPRFQPRLNRSLGVAAVGSLPYTRLFTGPIFRSDLFSMSKFFIKETKERQRGTRAHKHDTRSRIVFCRLILRREVYFGGRTTYHTRYQVPRKVQFGCFPLTYGVPQAHVTPHPLQPRRPLRCETRDVQFRLVHI